MRRVHGFEHLGGDLTGSVETSSGGGHRDRRRVMAQGLQQALYAAVQGTGTQQHRH